MKPSFLLTTSLALLALVAACAGEVTTTSTLTPTATPSSTSSSTPMEPNDFTVWLVGGSPPPADLSTEVMEAITAVAGPPRVVRVLAEDFASRYRLHVVERSKPPLDLIAGNNFKPFWLAAWSAKESGPLPNDRELANWLHEQPQPLLAPGAAALLTSGFLHRAADFVFIVEGSRHFAQALRLSQTMAIGERCTRGVGLSELPGSRQDSELGFVAEAATAAYVRGDETSLAVLRHPRAIGPSRITWEATADEIIVHGVFGNERLAAALTSTAFSSVSPGASSSVYKAGCKDVLSIWLAEEGHWKLLTITDDPISVGSSLITLTNVLADLSTESAELPTSAVLITEDGVFPRTPSGHIGEFTWEPSSSPTIAEIVEFDYGYASRLKVQRESIGRSGGLWSVMQQWHWRVWSIAPDGQIAFSETRTFVH